MGSPWKVPLVNVGEGGRRSSRLVQAAAIVLLVVGLAPGIFLIVDSRVSGQENYDCLMGTCDEVGLILGIGALLVLGLPLSLTALAILRHSAAGRGIGIIIGSLGLIFGAYGLTLGLVLGAYGLTQALCTGIVLVSGFVLGALVTRTGHWREDL